MNDVAILGRDGKSVDNRISQPVVHGDPSGPAVVASEDSVAGESHVEGRADVRVDGESLRIAAWQPVIEGAPILPSIHTLEDSASGRVQGRGRRGINEQRVGSEIG